MADVFERVRATDPERGAIIGGAGAYATQAFARLTYEQADIAANRFGHALLAAGVEPGDRVLILAENSVEALVAKIGVAKVGAVCAGVNPRLAADVVRHIVDILDPAFALIDGDVASELRQVVSALDVAVAYIEFGSRAPEPGWAPFADLLAEHSHDEPGGATHGDHPWEILFTSGTTSMPKGAVMSHLAAYSTGYGFALTHSRGVQREIDLRMAVLLPAIYHVGGIAHCLPAFLCGGTLVLGRRAGAADVAELVTAERPTALWGGSPQFLADLVATVDAEPGRHDLTSLTSIMWAWASLPDQTRHDLERLCGDVQLVGILGQTEAPGSTRFWPQHEPVSGAPVNRVGLPSAGTAAAIMQPDGTIVDPTQSGVAGELVYRSPAMTSGYYRDPDATAAAFAHGWFHSGDSCAFEDGGALVFVDRFKDMIKSGGENVSSQRVELVLLDHPDVDRAVVIGLPHDQWGEAVTAVVVRRQGSTASEADLIEHCKNRLSRFECPKSVLFVESYPEALGGKVRKVELRAAYENHYRGAHSHA